MESDLRRVGEIVPRHDLARLLPVMHPCDQSAWGAVRANPDKGRVRQLEITQQGTDEGRPAIGKLTDAVTFLHGQASAEAFGSTRKSLRRIQVCLDTQRQWGVF